MKLAETGNEEIISRGVEGAVGFTMQADATAFRVLSSQIYSDKILAPIRELSTNAWDANKDAGRSDSKIIVTLPCDTEPEFAVRDNGKGLTHDEVMNLYTVYFNSTRRNSNDSVGAYGLGSKSPFAYTDNFTVTSYQDGKCRTYVATMGDEGPTLQYLGEYNTTEMDGLEVRFGVRREDIRDFVNRAKAFYVCWESEVDVKYGNGEKCDIDNLRDCLDAETTFTGEFGDARWVKRELPSYGSGLARVPLRVVMGNVAYPVTLPGNAYSLHTEVDKALYWLGQLLSAKTELIIYVPIGAVDVTVSREGLEMTKRTIAYVTELCVDIAASLVQKDVDFVNAQDTYKKALMVFTDLPANVTRVFPKEDGFKTPTWGKSKLPLVKTTDSHVVDILITGTAPQLTMPTYVYVSDIRGWVLSRKEVISRLGTWMHSRTVVLVNDELENSKYPQLAKKVLKQAMTDRCVFKSSSGHVTYPTAVVINPATLETMSVTLSNQVVPVSEFLKIADRVIDLRDYKFTEAIDKMRKELAAGRSKAGTSQPDPNKPKCGQARTETGVYVMVRRPVDCMGSRLSRSFRVTSVDTTKPIIRLPETMNTSYIGSMTTDLANMVKTLLPDAQFVWVSSTYKGKIAQTYPDLMSKAVELFGAHTTLQDRVRFKFLENLRISYVHKDEETYKLFDVVEDDADIGRTILNMIDPTQTMNAEDALTVMTWVHKPATPHERAIINGMSHLEIHVDDEEVEVLNNYTTVHTNLQKTGVFLWGRDTIEAVVRTIKFMRSKNKPKAKVEVTVAEAF